MYDSRAPAAAAVIVNRAVRGYVIAAVSAVVVTAALEFGINSSIYSGASSRNPFTSSFASSAV